jgi:glycosyltransferase involved in cell wall biosynthesis
VAKKKILVSIDWFLPGYKAGGPIRSCANIISRLRDEFDFYVITSDTDFSETKPYPNITPNQWNKLDDGTPVYYFSKDQLHEKQMTRVICDLAPDILYMNSFFSRKFTLLPMRITRRHLPQTNLIVAPRGMLGKGALSIKPLKKQLFIWFAKLTELYASVKWHASTEQEAKEIRDVFGKYTTVHVALNLSALRSIHLTEKQKNTGELNLIFFSRISRKKNLHLALNALNFIKGVGKIHLDIFGTLEDHDYWTECSQLIKNIPQQFSAEYKGVIKSSEAEKAFSECHFFILPTMHENYGHSIVESLAFGVPVIISDQTPWHNLEERRSGWDIPLGDTQKLISVLEDALKMDAHTYRQWQQGAIAHAKEILDDRNALQQNRNLFSD